MKIPAGFLSLGRWPIRKSPTLWLFDVRYVWLAHIQQLVLLKGQVMNSSRISILWVYMTLTIYLSVCVCVFCLLKFYFSFNSFDSNLLVRTVKISYVFFCVCWTRMAGWDLKECFWEKDWRPLTFTMATCISRGRHMRQGQQDCSSAGCQQLQLLMLKATWRRHNDAEEVIWCSVSVLGHLFCVHL